MAEADIIKFFNRYTGRVETEQVYGAAWLRWIYGNPVGRLALEAVVKRPFFSRWYGWRMDREGSRHKVMPFIRDFGLDVREFADPPESFRTFNEFFHRRLKPGIRLVDGDPSVVVFPADGRHLGFPEAAQINGVFVKGQRFELERLLGNAELAARYARGSLVLSRLCPVDYHRFHFPLAGRPSETSRLNGPLYSVNPIALRRNLSYLWENRRTLTRLETEKFGLVLLLEIGATNVGSIVQTYRPGTVVEKGNEKGYFGFGGSSTLLLFEPGRVRLAADLVEQSRNQRELYAHVGDRLGTAI
ncbi:MAG: phosphatidylserine decarboxylase [Verrucomicrobiota bacterium]|nr:phosphatidylserine decarboxylase [Limisphaerales bacterium]